MRRLFGLAGLAALVLMVTSCVAVQSLDITEQEAFLEPNLAAGHPLDPLLFSVLANSDSDCEVGRHPHCFWNYNG